MLLNALGAPEPPSVVPNAAQLSREAKHMRVMLMLCVKEKVFDQAALESIFSQWLLCEQQNEGHVEETDAAFRRSLGRTYGPRSKDFLGAIDRAKVKLEQLKERKSRGELGSGGSIGGVPPPNLPPSSMGNPQIGMPGQMGGQIGGQPLSNQPPAQMMSHQSLGQMPHLAQPQQPPPQPHLTQQHPPQQYPPQHTQQHPPHPHPSQHPSQQHPPQHPPQHIGQPTLGNPQYYKPHTQQTLQQQQQQHQPPLQQSHLGLGQQMPHIQNNVPQIIGIQSSTQPSYKMQNLPPQQMTGPQSHPLPHHNPPGPTIGMTQQTMMYENRPPSLMNPSSNNDNIRPLPNMNPVNPMQTVNNPPQEPYKPPSHTPIPVDHDDHKDDKKKAANKKKGIEEFDDPKKRKSGAGMTGDVKKQKSKGEIAEKEVPRMVGGLPLPDSRIAPMTTGNPDDLDNITEKPNLQQEGLQVLSNRQMTGYIIDGGMLTKEEYSSRQLMRDNVHPYDRHDHAVLEPLALEPWMERNIVGKEILDRGMQSLFNMKLEMTSESRRLLSDGIQSHLKTIVENALEISRKRLNRTACSSFYESFQQLKNHNGSISTEHHLSSVAIKWGPSLSSILSEEETKLKQFYKDYSDIDEEKLKEKMRQYDEERMKLAGAKRKAAGSGGSLIESEPQITWWDKDLSFEDEGILSYEKIAEVWKKNDIALKHELGQNSKRKSQKKGDNAPTEGNNDLKVGLRVNDSSIPMDTDELKNGEGEWKNQVCPIAIPSETHVTSDDLQFVISKMNNRNGGLIGSRSDREKIRKARFLRKPLTR